MPSILQSALHPASMQAGRIEVLWWVLFWICAVVYLLVAAAVLLAVRRARSENPERPDEGQLFRVVSGATAVTVVVLFGLLATSVWTGRAVASGDPQHAVLIKVVGQQWW